MFTFNPNLAVDEDLEDGDAAWENFPRESSDNEEEDIQVSDNLSEKVFIVHSLEVNRYFLYLYTVS